MHHDQPWYLQDKNVSKLSTMINHDTYNKSTHHILSSTIINHGTSKAITCPILFTNQTSIEGQRETSSFKKWWKNDLKDRNPNEKSKKKEHTNKNDVDHSAGNETLTSYSRIARIRIGSQKARKGFSLPVIILQYMGLSNSSDRGGKQE